MANSKAINTESLMKPRGIRVLSTCHFRRSMQHQISLRNRWVGGYNTYSQLPILSELSERGSPVFLERFR